jgi:sugar-specific transcriptional regulator TrmB
MLTTMYTPINNMSASQTLKKLGLNDKEARVYLALLKQGKTKPSALAKITKLNRATLYNVAKGLVSRGIIAEDLSGKVLHFVALRPENLHKTLDQAKREMKEKEELIKVAVNELNLINSEKSYPVPKIRFIEEHDLEKFLFDNLIKWQEEVISADGIWRGFQDHTFVENYFRWIEATWKTKESRHGNYQARAFTNESAVERKLKGKYQPKRQVRFLSDTNFTATVWICGNYLVMISTRQHPFYLVEIHDQTMALNMREMLKKLWSADTK